MSELASVLSLEDFRMRREMGAIAPLEGLRVLDCGDERPLTNQSYQDRARELGAYSIPGRFFGGVVGLEVVTLVAIAAEHGQAAITTYVDNFGPEAIVDLAADMAQRAAAKGMTLTVHSSDGSEGNPRELADHHTHSNPLGCAFCASCGGVVHIAASPRALQDSQLIASMAGKDTAYNDALKAAADGAGILSRVVDDTLSIHRGAVHHAATKKTDTLRTPILAGPHAPNDLAVVTFDLAGVRASAHHMAQMQTPRYHHTPELAAKLTGQLMPEMPINPALLHASALLVGATTRIALSGPKTPDDLKIEIIPTEYAAHVA